MAAGIFTHLYASTNGLVVDTSETLSRYAIGSPVSRKTSNQSALSIRITSEIGFADSAEDMNGKILNASNIESGIRRPTGGRPTAGTADLIP